MFCLLAAGTGLAQHGGMLDLYTAKVKPEKRAEFDAACKKMVDANRRHNGDNWLAIEALYADLNTVVFISARKDYEDLGRGMDAFEGSIGRALGMAGAHALEQQFSSALESARTETRARRWDLSYNPPADRAAYVQAVGNARYLRAVLIQIRPGHSTAFEAEVKEVMAAMQKGNEPGARWVSQVTDGGSPFTYVITRLFTSWSDLDKGSSLEQLLGDEGYTKFEKMTADDVESVEYGIFRIVPELSNPPADISAVAPDFWSPKPKTAVAEKKQPESSK